MEIGDGGVRDYGWYASYVILLLLSFYTPILVCFLMGDHPSTLLSEMTTYITATYPTKMNPSPSLGKPPLLSLPMGASQ